MQKNIYNASHAFLDRGIRWFRLESSRITAVQLVRSHQSTKIRRDSQRGALGLLAKLHTAARPTWTSERVRSAQPNVLSEASVCDNYYRHLPYGATRFLHTTISNLSTVTCHRAMVTFGHVICPRAGGDTAFWVRPSAAHQENCRLKGPCPVSRHGLEVKFPSSRSQVTPPVDRFEMVQYHKCFAGREASQTDKFSSKAMNIGISICTCHLTLI